MHHHLEKLFKLLLNRELLLNNGRLRLVIKIILSFLILFYGLIIKYFYSEERVLVLINVIFDFDSIYLSFIYFKIGFSEIYGRNMSS